MVGWLVHQQQVVFLEQEFEQGHTGSLPSRKLGEFGRHLFAGELETTERRPDVAVLEIWTEFLNLFNGVEVEVKGGVVLVEITDFATGSEVNGATGQLLITVDEFQQGRFPLAVAAHDADAITLAHLQGLVVEDFAVKALKRLRTTLHLEHVHAGFVRCFKGKNEWFTLLRDPCTKGFELLLHAFNHLVFGGDGLVVFVGPLHLRHGAHRGLDFLLNVGNGLTE